ncbi:MAG: hypothetical protein G01um101433_867 [Parcubacteria group bacterium Gr01-1014_33]|nr:MAG: hypothetical protein G01um101433_867 [Parcubacteria group bacterium Gr01-1014_33]
MKIEKPQGSEKLYQSVRKVWESQRETYAHLRALGVEKFMKESDDMIREAIRPDTKDEDADAGCGDERVGGRIRLAGVGILWTEREVISALTLAGAKGIKSHKGCGAAKIFTEQNGLNPADAEQCAQEHAQKIAHNLNIPYRGHRNVTPERHHIAHIVYVDGTGKWNVSRAPGLLPGFHVSRRFVSASYAAKEVDIYASIASDKLHGFGTLISEKEPILIIVIGDPKASAFSQRRLIAELQPIGKRLRDKRIPVAIDGFTPQFL